VVRPDDAHGVRNETVNRVFFVYCFSIFPFFQNSFHSKSESVPIGAGSFFVGRKKIGQAVIACPIKKKEVLQI